MIKTKLLEIRDAGTFIPALAVCFDVSAMDEEYLLRRAGYGVAQRAVLLVNLVTGDSRMDPHTWPSGTRTMTVAHLAIAGHAHRDFVEGRAVAFHDLAPGDVVDVEYLLGIRSEPKRSEQVAG